ncbi:urease subunit beta [Halostagnicola sp. A-GB9-2]|uniref:urease subunit beta n=1 Tax=Halostagnicola sp. A-GB9-2 TaxID=3048066 RepID=UPI0024BFFFA4|nr:urease subunit beta [Halostagnicola sp. A-GB9-2]MDJ1430483.1 urease subunit beta [Halostagnicola sp. A-GB9-2]
MTSMVPGELLPASEPVPINADRATTSVTVENTGDRPVQVGSHFHFFEANPGLLFDRNEAYGYRLNIPAGTAIRFEPGCERAVDLVAIGGDRIVHGMGGLVNGPLDDAEIRRRALERAEANGYLGVELPAESNADGSETETNETETAAKADDDGGASEGSQ